MTQEFKTYRGHLSGFNHIAKNIFDVPIKTTCKHTIE